MGLCGETHAVLGTVELPLCNNGLMVYHKFHVFQRQHHDIILGLYCLEQNNAHVDVHAKTLSLQSGVTSISFINHNSRHSTIVNTSSSVLIPPRSEVIMSVDISTCFSAN